MVKKVTTEFFGKLSDLAKAQSFELPADVKTLSDFTEFVAKNDQALRTALLGQSVRVLINDRVVHGDPPVHDGDQISYLPPVSGG